MPVVSLGFFSVINGLWSLIFGRRNWVLSVPLLVLFAILMVASFWIGLRPAAGS